MQELVYGVIYSRFDEKIGPTAVSWLPSSISNDIKNIVSLKSINILMGANGKTTKTLAILPFPSMNLKSLVQAFNVMSKVHRGGSFDASLTLLFNEEIDLIYYKYIENLESIFNETTRKLKKIEESNPTPELISEEIENFYKKSLNTLSELRNAEISSKEEDAFIENGQNAQVDKEMKGYRFKIIVCGDPQVGKTSIILRFTDKAFRRTYIPTVGVNICEKGLQYKDAKMELILWDIAGQSKFLRMRKHFYVGADGQILVFSLANEETLKNIRNWYEDIKKHVEGDILGILVGNKSDLVNIDKIKREEILKLAFDLNLNYIETSALTGENIYDSFRELAKILYEKSQEIERNI